ncbi:MAG TPA: cytochrome c3 family protein, partial [Anaerolineae bacterium]|nr:cytochrome c3 family protein [Anaerolineae bacterium]
DGAVTEGEANYGNRYASWTPRLLRAAYNYQVSLKDPGEYAHGGKYIIQLLYDSIESLNEALATPVDLSMANRIDHGHFAGSEEAFRHWDEDGAVPGSCSRCHSAAGLPLYIEQGAEIEQPTANGLNCATCHSDLTTFTLYESESVEFPSGAVLSLAEVDEENGLKANLCMNCHQGRSYSGTVDARIARAGDIGPNDVSDALGFVNVHYFPAGGSLFGSEAEVGYQYEGKEYNGRNEHVSGFDTCVECHDAHALEVVAEDCGNCHDGVSTVEDLHTIRVSETDFDGDGDAAEGLVDEIATMRETLLLAMEAYAEGIEGVNPIVYDSHAYPYFFDDAGERYATWTPALLRAAYNYQYATKDPGGFAHNGLYVLQTLYDSLEDIGGDVSGMTRP